MIGDYASKGMLGGVMELPFQVSAETWGVHDLAEQYGTPLVSDVRTLLLSGSHRGVLHQLHLDGVGVEEVEPTPGVVVCLADGFGGLEISGVAWPGRGHRRRTRSG